MRKIVLALAVVICVTPAWAGIEIDVSQPDTGQSIVVIDYNCTDPNLVRAFGLAISVDGDCNIGDVNWSNPEFYIHPTNIVIEGGQITQEGSPLAPGGGDNQVYLEMGSLYAAEDPCHPTPPAAAGTLIRIVIEGSSDCNCTVEENAARGGVVMEDTDQTFDPGYVVGLPVTIPVVMGYVYPDCWGYSGTTYLGQCHGDCNDADLFVGITDFFGFADHYDTKKFDPGYNPYKTYEPCADNDRDGDVDITDFFEFADNYDGSVEPNCPAGDLNEVYKP